MAKVEDYHFPAELWYDPREHLWVRVDADGTTVTVGVDEMGQEALGEVVYVDLAGVGREVRRGEALGSLEAEKMVRPVLAPVSGTVVDVNDAVLAAPRLLNSDPYGGGWLFKIRATRWAAECHELLHGDDAVTAWARGELERHA
ncbi:MAG: glycine cleavage system protein H [candidate division NC10 bacterium]